MNTVKSWRVGMGIQLTLKLFITIVTFSWSLFEGRAFAFEQAAVLPKGVRRVQFTSFNVHASSFFNAAGRLQPLGQKLERSLTFGDVARGADGVEQNSLAGLMLSEGYSLDDVAGSFNGTMHVDVAGAIWSAAYGISDRWTIGIGSAWVRGQSRSAIGFVPTKSATDFANAVSSRGGQSAAERYCQGMNAAVDTLQNTLVSRGFNRLGQWKGEGASDMQVIAKQRNHQGQWINIASRIGVNLPTGRKDDPNELADVAFSEGSLGTLVGGMSDVKLTKTSFINAGALYTWFGPSTQDERLPAADNEDEWQLQSVQVGKRGIVRTDVSLQGVSLWGLSWGVGHLYEMREAVQRSNDEGFRAVDPATQQQLAQVKFGFNGVDFYRRGKIPMPFVFEVSGESAFAGRNEEQVRRVLGELQAFF
jgi:hypothetical protein